MTMGNPLPMPLRDQILILRDAAEEVSAGGVALPDTVVEAEKPSEGVVLAIGRLVEDVRVGDRVVISAYSGVELMYNEEIHLLAKESNVLAITARALDLVATAD